MARISSYDQDATLNQNDKLLGTDSLTGVTKNFSIDSIFSIAGDVIDMFDGPIYQLQNFKAAGSDNLYGVLNFNAGAASNTSFANVSVIYFSVEDVGEHSLANYFDALNGHYFRIAKKGDLDTFGIYEVTNVEDYESGAYKKLTVSLIRSNGSIALNEKVFLSSHTEKHLLDLNTKSVEDLGDVTSVGSGQIITTAERSNLVNLNNNALLHADVVNNLTTVTTDVPLAANQGKLLKDEVDAINTLLTSDNVDLDTLQEVVDFIEANKDSLDNLGISNIAGLQGALDAKEDSVTGKGLSTNDFTDTLLTKLNGIAENAEVNVQANWSENVTTSDAFIQNKPTDLTTLNTHNVTELSDITDAGSGAIITGAERTKLSGIASGAEVNVQANWNETNASSDAFIQNKPTGILSASSSVTDLSDVTSAGSGAIITSAERTKLSNAVEESRNFQISGTANQIQVNPSTPQDLSANRSVTVSLPSDVTISSDLTVGDTIELSNAQSSTPTFDNGIYYATEDSHDTLHFRYDGHDLSIDYLTENIPTGILNGGELSTNTNTTFDVAAGDGIINILNKDVADPHPEIKKVAWSATTVTHTLGDAADTDQLNTWIYVDSSGNIQQTLTVPSPSLWRSNIILGSVIHSENVIRFVKTFPRPAYSNGNTYAEFVEIFGPLKKSGHLLTVNSTNTMALDRAAGVSFALGRNYETDAEEPNLVSDSASTPVFHRYSSTSTGFTKDDGTAGAGYTSIDPTKYDNNGTLTTVSAGQYTVQRLYHFPNNTNVIVAYYGKAQYNSLDVAEKNYLLEDFQEADNTSQQAIYLGAIILKGNVSNLGTSSDAKILTGGIFRSLSATNLGGVAVGATIDDLNDVDISAVADDQLLQYNSSTGNWENTSVTSDDIPAGTSNLYFSSANNTKLSGIETGATADQTDSEIETAYNNQVSQVSSSERTAGTETGIRRFAPADVKSMIDAHGLALTDLSVGSPASASGSGAIAYNNSTGVFTYTPPDLSSYVDGSGSANKIAFWTDADTLSNDSSLHWDSTNDRLGIDNTSPSETLDVTGNAAISGDLKIDTNTLYVDSSSDLVGIGTSSPGEELHIKKSQEVEIKLETNSNYSKKISFYDGSTSLGEIRSNTNSGLAFYEKGTEVLNLDTSIAVHVKNTNFKVDTDTLFVDESTDKVGINTASPSEALDVVGDIKVSADVHIADNIIHEGDADTKITFGADQIILTTGGVENIRFTPTEVAVNEGSDGTLDFRVESNTGTHLLFVDASANAIGVNTSSPSRTNGITIKDSGLRLSNSYGNFDLSQLYSHTDLRLATLTSKLYVSNASTGPGGPNDNQLAPILVGQIGVKETSPTVAIDAGNATDAIKVPVGTTAERPTGAAGMFRYNSSDGQFEGYTTEWGAIAGSGGGTSTIERDTFNGDGSTTAFTLSTSVSDEINTQVYVDGVYQSKLTYSTSGTTLTFSEAPPTGTNNIEVIHVTSVTIDGASALNKNTFTGDGSTTGFSLSAAPTSEDFTFVFIQGVYQEKSTYTVSNNTITFSTAPQNGYTIEVMHINAVNVQQSSYMEYDGFTGTGSQTAFTLVNGNPTDEKFTMVFLQGVYQEKSTYSLSNRVITFTTAPDLNYTIEVISINGGGLLTNPSTRPTVSVISSNTTAVANSVYVLTANLTLTLPANPQIGDSIKISNRSGVATCVLGANNKKIMGAAANLTLDTASASFELIYSGVDQGWVIIGQ